jgi:serine/threonine protein kinase
MTSVSMVGTKLGPYEILAPIGAGGMGEVYRARDPRVGREVAIKVSAEKFNERFEREARAVAALNHPNICTLFDVGPHYIVMELVEGQTLEEKIAGGTMALREALEIARQIADALEAAHEKGIIHRDLKPGNIKIRPDGTVKVLDFGLAKVAETQAVSLPDSPTLSMAATQQGVILGTAAYMSPEQARGKPVDKRADIWAFGCVLYEMLVGKQLFSGEDVTELLAAVVKEQPDLSKIPAEVRRLLQSCLEKDPRKRLRDIGDIPYLLDETTPSEVPAKRTGKLGWVVASVLGLVTLTVIAGWLKTGSGAGEIPKTVLTIVPPSGTILDPVGGLGSAPDISPNGAFVMYEASDSAGVGLFVRPLNSLSAQRVPGSERRSNAPFWSADSTSVLYPAGDQLIKVFMPDGAPQVIAKVPSASRGGTWSDAGTILISFVSGFSSMPASGGDLQPVDVSALGSGTYLNPEFLPGGEDFLFLFAPGPIDDMENCAIYLATLRKNKLMNPVVLLRNATAAQYTPAGGGRILFVREDKLYSQKLDRNARKVEGEAVLIVGEVTSVPGGGTNRGDFSVARTGTIAWRPGRAALNQVATYDRQGHRIGATGPPGTITALRLSPDERQLLAGRWVLDDNQQGRAALPAGTSWFGWSPDGSNIIGFRRPDQFVETSATGSQEVRGLAGSNRASGLVIPIDISSDAKWLLGIPSGGRSILAESMQGPATRTEPMVVVQTGELLGSPHFSPDGRWIVYYARDPQTPTARGLYVQPFPGPGPRRQIATGGMCPEWRRDGREIVYLTPEGEIQSVAVESDGSNLRFGTPQKLFFIPRKIATTSASRPIAVTRDGSRIYILQPVEQPDSNLIHIMIGELK